MAEKRISRLGETPWLQGTSTIGPMKKLRRPLGLVLGGPEKPSAIAFDTNAQVSANCGLCSLELPENPRLCKDCQIWNDAQHVFECLGEAATWEGRTFLTLQEVLDRTECLMCEAVGRAVLQKLANNASDLTEELARIEIMNCGPYCFGQEALDALNPELLRKYGRHQMDCDDLRLSATQMNVRSGESEADYLKVVIYLVLTSPPGSTLHNCFADFDSYKVPDTTPDSDPGEGQFNLGIHRRLPYDGSVLLQPTIGLQLKLHYAYRHRTLLDVPQWENEYFDISLVSRWLQNCNTNHTSRANILNKPVCHVSADQAPLPNGFKAIDTFQYCIVELPGMPIPSYAALSYTWGATSGMKELQLEVANKEELCIEGSLRGRSGIPDIILDAITLCADLGVQYLWIDRLCIVQDDLEAKMDQINAMDRIYNMAGFTIVAAVPLGIGLPGVRGRPRKSYLANYSRRFDPKMRFVTSNFRSTVISSFWNTRGWTYQERVLSRRAIYVTEWQTYFLCYRGAEQEEIGGFAASVNPWDLHLFSTYSTTVADYTSRNLTFGSDILNAFAGIGNHFEAATGKLLFYGLPERYFAQALLWDHDNDIEKRHHVPDIPSWSWAAWKGRSKYDMNSKTEKSRIGSLVRFYIQAKQGIRCLDGEEVWFWRNVDLNTLDKLPVIDQLYPEMRFMPDAEATEAAWRDCPQNPWTVAHQSSKDHIATIAATHPGKLVFRTTSALVTLQPPTSYDYVESVDYIKLNIVSSNNIVVGQMAKFPQAWVQNHINMDMKHKIIVLAAGIASEPARYAQTHSTLHSAGHVQEPRTEDSPWFLHIMLVDEAHPGVLQRVGIGTVEMRLWKYLKPEWCNVVLS
jgi:hypothetical protein